LVRSTAIWILIVSLLLVGVVACEEDSEDIGEGGVFDSPTGIAIHWPYAYVTNANFDLSSGKDGHLSVVDLRIALQRRDRAVIRTVETDPYLSKIILNAEGTVAYVAERRHNTVLLFDLTDPARPDLLDLDDSESGQQGITVGRQPFGLTLTPEEDRLLVACLSSGVVSVVDLAAQQLTKNIALSSGVNEIKIDPAGRYAYVTNKMAPGITMIDVETGSYAAAFDPGLSFSLTAYDNRGLDFTPDGERLFVAARNPGALLMVDATKLPLYPEDAVLRLLPTDLGPSAVAVTPDGSEVWVANFVSNTVFAYDTDNGDLLGVMRTGAGPNDIAMFADPVEPDHYYALTVNFNSHNLTLLDVRAKEVIWAIP